MTGHSQKECPFLFEHMVKPSDFQWREVGTSQNGDWRGFNYGLFLTVDQLPLEFYRANESFMRQNGYTGEIATSYQAYGSTASDGGGG